MLINKLKKIIPNLADDGSKELAKHYVQILEDEKSLASLRNNLGFQIILDKMKSDFVNRMRDIVKDDPELSEIWKMYIRILGSGGAEEEINKHLEQFLDNENEPTVA